MTVEQTCAGPEPVAGNYFVSTYPPFSCWTELATDEYREHLQKPIAGDVPFGLYVHVPFCEERCEFCYYLSHDRRGGDVDRYLDAVIEEVARYAAYPAFADRSPTFVYFGGGTPSLLSVPRIERLVAGLKRAFPWSRVREVTFECAPRSVTEDKMQALRDCGVTRLSMGVQQLDDDVLRANGRVHLIEDVEKAWRAIRAVPFDVVNLDLIVGLVGETEASYVRSLGRVLAMEPESITTYQLEIPLNTPLWRSIRDGTFAGELPSWEEKRARLRRGRDRMEQAGYTMTTAYAALRDPVRHRFVYQHEQYHGVDLLGVGVSAFSYVAGHHQQNRSSIDEYAACLARGELPLFRAHALTDRERRVRELVLQLKLGVVSVAEFREKFGVDVVSEFGSQLRDLASKQWLTFDADHVRVTREGILRVDRILPGFYLPEHRSIRYS